MGTIQSSLGWTGSSAERAKGQIDFVRQAFMGLADKTDQVQRNYRVANSVVHDAAQALDALPGMEVPHAYVDAAKIGADIVYLGLSLPAKTVIDMVVDTLSSGREEAAKAAVETLEQELLLQQNELRKIRERRPEEGLRVPDKVPDPDTRGGNDPDSTGGSGGGHGGSYLPSGRSLVQPSSADMTVPAVLSPGSTGAGDVLHRLRSDGSVSPSDPRGIEGNASGGLSGDKSGSGTGGVGSGRVDLGGKSATAAFGGGGGIGAGILGAGGVGAGARLASGGLKGLGGGAAAPKTGGVGGIGSASGGIRPGSGGAVSASGGVRLGGAGGGLSGAATSAAVTTGNGSPSANIGAGTGGTTGTGAGGVGVMGGGAPGTSQERGRTRGLGGIIVPKLEDDDELPPRSAAAGPGSRDAS